MYFSTINKKKKYKLQHAKKMCSQCTKEVDLKEDHFVLQLNWKIKNSPDMRTFCSMKCLNKWTKD
ncbi:MAG: hypothetical protein KAT43_04985 [Nanoarchaeota archaeon]|nr:hypothetical protein [Nanoarchaeota archaeon]